MKPTRLTALLMALVLAQFGHADDYQNLAPLNPFAENGMSSAPQERCPAEESIEASDGVMLDAKVYVPDGAAPSEGYPAIVLPGGWGQNKCMYELPAQMLRGRGYLVIAYANRGFSHSGGLADVAGPATLDDISTVIDWLVENYPVDNIGLAGISYGAGLSILGSIEDERVEAVAALATWSDLLYDLYPNDTVNFVWGSLLMLAERVTEEVPQLWENIRERKNLEQVEAFSRSRSPIYRIEELNSRPVPTLIANTYGDYLFKPNRVVDLYNALEGPKKLLLSPGTHGITESLPSPTMHYIWRSTARWFDHYLKGENNGVGIAPPVAITRRVQDYQGREFYLNFPPMGETTQYFLHPRISKFDSGYLEHSRYLGAPALNLFSGGRNTIADTGIPIIAEILEGLGVKVRTVRPLDELSGNFAIQYTSPALAETMKIRGNPRVQFWFKPSKAVSQLHFYLYDTDASGFGHLISHVPVTVHDAEIARNRLIDVDFFTTSYDVPAGNSLRLVVDTEGNHYENVEDKNYLIAVPYRRILPSSLQIPHL